MVRQWIFIAASFLITGCATLSRNNYVNEGNQYARDGLYQEAVESYRRALTTNPDLALAHRNLGIVLVKTGDYKNAVKHIEKSLPQYENNFETNFYLGESFRALEQYAEAIYRYQKATKIRDQDPKALKALAWSYFKIRYYSEALSTAQRLQKIAPADEQVSIILARTLLKLKRGNQALQALENVKDNLEENSLPYFESVEGDIYFELGNYSDAIKSYRAALKEQPMLAGALLGLGRCMLQDGKTTEAIPLMERAVRIRPHLTEAHYLLGKAYETTDREKSLRFYQNFKRRAATDPEYLNQISEVTHRMSLLESSKNAISKTVPAATREKAATAKAKERLEKFNSPTITTPSGEMLNNNVPNENGRL